MDDWAYVDNNLRNHKGLMGGKSSTECFQEKTAQAPILIAKKLMQEYKITR